MSLHCERSTYPCWEDASRHLFLHEANDFAVGGGALRPHSPCPMHSHNHPSVALSIFNTSTIAAVELIPPHFDPKFPKRSSIVHSQGDCFSSAVPPASPLVHSYTSTSTPIAFILVEARTPIPSKSERLFASIEGNGVQVLRKQNSSFWTSLQLKIDPGARALVRYDQTHHRDTRHLTTVVSPLENDLSALLVLAKKSRQTICSGLCEGQCLEVIVIEDDDILPNDITICNQSESSWMGTVIDVFGERTQ